MWLAVDHFFHYFYRMKFFAFIMALLVLALSIWPCADDGSVLEEAKAKTEISKQHSGPEHQEHNDVCSPFCHCTCCPGFSINHFFPVISSLLGNDRKFYIPYLPGDPIQYSPPVWQPPKRLV